MRARRWGIAWFVASALVVLLVAAPASPAAGDEVACDPGSEATTTMVGGVGGNLSGTVAFEYQPSLSDDGRFVAFESKVPHAFGDAPASVDVFVVDTVTDEVEVASLEMDGTGSTSWAVQPAISGDGRYVVFASSSGNLVEGDTNGEMDVFRYDRVTGTTELVSVGALDFTDEGPTWPDVSYSGRFVSFVSDSMPLAEGDPPFLRAAYRRDMDLGTTERISVTTGGVLAPVERLHRPTISDDGQRIAFRSLAHDLVVGQPANSLVDVFVRDVEAGETILVSRSSAGGAANGNSWEPTLSGDGQFVAFRSSARNLVPGVSTMGELYVRNLATGTTTRIPGGMGATEETVPSLSDDGARVAFIEPHGEAWVRDTETGATIVASNHGDPANFPIVHLALSGDGRSVAYTSTAPDHVPGDGGFDPDYFHATLAEPPSAGPFPDVRGNHPFCDDVTWLVAQGITGGFPDGTYRPAQGVSRQAMAAFLYRFAGEPPFEAPDTPTFSDVPTDHGFYDEIEWLVAEGITGGTSDGSFRPRDPVSRASMAAFLFRFADGPPFDGPDVPTFPDVPTGHVFFDEVEWLFGEGITGGFSDGAFRPASVVSRGSMAAFLHRAAD